MAQQRVLGVDVSWNNRGTCGTTDGITQTAWNTAHNTPNANGFTRQFVMVRATRGGTTGLGETAGTPCPNSGQETLSRRYDDPEFLRTVTRATTAGLFAGPYHFGRPDNAGNTGTDEADHFIEYASAYMRPGYLMPVYDWEADAATVDASSQFAIDLSSRIYARMQIRPAVYIGGSRSSTIESATQSRQDQLAKPATVTPSVVGPAFPMLWNPYYANQADPESIDVQNDNPKAHYSGFYGPWDDYGNAQPWSFWQYSSTVSVPGITSIDSGVDGDVSQGDIEYVKNYLVPAIWWSDISGDWSTLTNWNSGQPLSTFNSADLNNPPAPYTPHPGTGQTTPFTSYTLPVPRLPGAAGSGPTSGQYDTVILERPSANITVTLSTGTHNVRKLYMRETLNITGGSLTVNYDPTYRADNSSTVLHGGPISAQFSGPVALSNSASFTVHTLQVDTNNTFTLAGGTLTFNTINLMPHSSTPAKILVNGDVNLNPLSNNITAVIAKGSGSGSSGFIDLGGAARTLTVANGTADVDLSIAVPMSNGALTKSGVGTMQVVSNNTYTGGTIISAGRLLANNTTGSGTGSGAVTVNGGFLGGTGMISGAVTVNSGGTVSPGASIGTLTFSTAPIFGGTNFMEIDRNGGSPLADKIVLTSGTLTYGGTLVVSNTGATLVSGDVFTLFSAPAYSGSFAATNLPSLNAGLAWDLGSLTVNGTIKVVSSSSAPSITTQPQSQTISAGQTATFTVTAGGTAPLSYQWRKNGGAMSTATTSALTLSGVAQTDAASYTVVVTNSSGSITSSITTLTVIDPPAITTQPSSRTNSAGTTAAFTITATGTSPVHQWRKNGAALSNGGNVSGAASASLTLTGVVQSDAASYTVTVTNTAGSVTSVVVTLTVTEPPGITTQPPSQTIIAGQDAVFSVTATGSPTLSYQWTFNNANISSATQSSYTRFAAQAADAGSYRVVITNALGSITSAPAVLTVNYSLTVNSSTGGSVSPTPNASGFAPGSAVALTATPNTDFAFTGWSGDASGTNNPLSVTLTTNKTVTASFTNTLTEIIIDNLDAAATFPGWSTGTSSIDKYLTDYRFANSAAGGTLVATFTPNIGVAGLYDVYIWYPQGSNRATNAPWTIVYSGGSTNVSVDQTGNGGSWRLIAASRPFQTGTGGHVSLSSDIGYSGKVVLADAVRLTYTGPLPPAITTQPQSHAVNQNVDALFTVVATGTAPLAYQWRFNNTNIFGATLSSYTRAAVQAGDAGSYSVVITNAAGSVTSSVAVLIVNLPPSITCPQPVNVQCTGNVPASNPSAVQSSSACGPTTNSFVGDATSVDGCVTTITRTYRATDACGLSSDCQQIITVEDTTPPVVTCPSNVSVATYAQIPSVNLNSVSTSDNCGGTVTVSFVGDIAATNAGIITVTRTYRGTDTCGNADDCSQTITAPVTVPPGITAQPASLVLTQGNNATFTVTATGDATLGFQWKFNGGSISGATLTSYTRSNLVSSDAGSYSVVITNGVGSSNSVNAVLTVRIPPGISAQPQSLVRTQGNSATFTVTATGDVTLGYQWKLNGGNISGATQTSYTRSNLQSSDAGSYSVTVTNSTGTSNSANVVLTVRIPPSISSQPQGGVVIPGSIMTFTVSATGDAPLGYQWKFNGTNISGATTTAYQIAIAQPADAGSYSILVTNPIGYVVSVDASLMVAALMPARIDWIAIAPDKKIHLQISGGPGNFEVQEASLIAAWSALTNFTATNSVFEFIDGDTNRDLRYYRVKSLP